MCRFKTLESLASQLERMIDERMNQLHALAKLIAEKQQNKVPEDEIMPLYTQMAEIWLSLKPVESLIRVQSSPAMNNLYDSLVLWYTKQKEH